MKRFPYLALALLLASGMAPEKRKDIPKDATLFHGKYYKVFEKKCSWHEAEALCEKTGGRLASIKSKEEDEFLRKLRAGKCLWFGGSDEAKEGDWRWRDGTEMAYQNWADGEPDDWKGKEDWMVVGWPGGERFKTGKWGDTISKYRKQIDGFMCEWDK